jgi:hypothetical protein
MHTHTFTADEYLWVELVITVKRAFDADILFVKSERTMSFKPKMLACLLS